MKRPEPRKSALHTLNPITTPPTPPTPQAQNTQHGQNTQHEQGTQHERNTEHGQGKSETRSVATTKITVRLPAYITQEAKNAYLATLTHTGYTSFGQFVAQALEKHAHHLATTYNNNTPFTPTTTTGQPIPRNLTQLTTTINTNTHRKNHQ